MNKHTNQAASYITVKVPTIGKEKTVLDIKTHLLSAKNQYDSIHYTYILDESGYLVGVISIKEILTDPELTPLTTYTKKPLVVARRYSSAERVAQLAITHNISAVPIVDRTKRFLGVVTADDIHDILNHEHSRDILQFAGVSSEHTPNAIIFDERPLVHVRSRLPWLLLGLAGGVAAAFVVGGYEEALSSHIALAAFIPAIVYIADSVGSQTQMLFIRALALNQSLSLRSYVGREVFVNLFLAGILGLAILLLSYFLVDSFIIGIILGVSVFLTVLVSVAVAIVFPYLSQLIHKDPAIASGPVATVCRDILSLVIYLSVAGYFLPYL